MKKSLLLLFAALATLVASAQTKVEIDGIWYDLYSETLQAEVTFKGDFYDSYSDEYSGSIAIPATITYEGADYSVTSIGEVAFYECTSLTAVTIPESVTSIKRLAFYGCTSLTSVTIPATTTYEGGTSIGTSAFGSCSSLKAITIPDWVTGLEYAAFRGCSSLTSVTIPENSRLTWMGECVFERCSSLTSITLPESLTSIDNFAFYLCSSLATVTIPENSRLTWMGECVFEDCSNLTSITIPQKVTELRRALFNYCDNLTSVIIPHGVTSIGDYVFWDCRNLKGITCNAATPPTISSASTFYNVDRSIPIYVPAGSVEDYRNAKYWSEFTNIQTFLASGTCGDNLTWRLTEEYELVIEGTGEMYDYEYENQPWYEYSESIQTISLSASVTSIGNYAFYNCTSLTNIVIPEGVTSIGEDVFFGCSSLTAINIAEGNANYDSREGCNAIIETSSNTLIAGCASTIIPESVTSIGDGAFRNCSSLTAITIPESVTSIGKLAFAWCNSLTAITVAERNTVYDSRGGCNAIIETSSNILIAGCSTTVIPEGIESIGYGAFNGHGLTAITIPEGVTSIGEGAFAYCSSLTSITIPESVTSIENKAFAGCNSLTAVHISSIGAWCNINFVYSESNPLYYAKNLFLNGEPVRELIIPEDVTSIGSQPFAYCSSLTSITIPESVTSIEGIAFYDCSSLTAITCKATTPPTIGNSYTFYNVDKSIPVYVPAGSVEAYKSAQYWSEFTNILPLAEVKEFTLSVSAADYATLYLDYNAKIPVGVEIYYAASVEGDRLKMTQITDVLPAGTGVIVRATKGTYTFTEIEGKYDAIEGNLLVGTTTKTLITTLSGYAYYVLANVDGVAMYKPQLTKGCFYNNANKAYLVLKMDDNLGIFDDEVNTDDEGTQLSNRLRFDFGGTTGIEQTTDNSQQTTVIYDLQGRKVTDTEGLKGIYIIDGRKVIIK